MDALFEKQLIEVIEPVYKKGRNGDWDHVLRMVKLCKYLLKHENADENIVLPAAYLHDIGWSAVDFSDFNKAMPGSKTKSLSFIVHMEKGAVIAERILSKLNYVQNQIKEIQSIINVHDLPDTILQMNNINAILVMEADRLDRYGKTGLERFKTMFGADKLKGQYWQEAKQSRLDGLENWFKTKTSVSIAQKLAIEMGLFD